jgi:hypothetical protein
MTAGESMHTRFAAALVALVLMSVPALSGEPPRRIQVRHDLAEPDAARALEVWVNCDGDDASASGCRIIAGTAAFGFELKASDRVVLRMQWIGGADTRGEIAHAVTGANLHEKDLDALRRLVGGAAVSKDAAEARVAEAGERVRVEIESVADDLVAGGRLTATFNVKTRTTGDDGKVSESVTDTAGPLTFRVEAEEPRLTVSTGLAFTTGREPEVAIVRSSTILTFQKDGETQQAYQQVIALRDNDGALKPIQALATFANFRLWPRTYASAGFQLNQSFFQEPLVGLTYRHPFGHGGLNVTAGAHLSRELEILEDSGFAAGQLVDPTIGLTADDIPVRWKYTPRFVLGVSLDF